MGETWRAAKPPMAARCWSNVFPITLGPKQNSANLTFSVATLKRNFKKIPEGLITSYLTFDALILLSPENQIQALEPYHLQSVKLPHIVLFHKEMQSKISPSLMQRVSLRTLLSIEHTAAYVEVQPMWRSSAWIFLSPALVTRLHMFFISPHMFLVTVFLYD